MLTGDYALFTAQRIGRGYNGRRIASQKRAAQRRAAMMLQGLWRKRQARRAAFEMKRKVAFSRLPCAHLTRCPMHATHCIPPASHTA